MTAQPRPAGRPSSEYLTIAEAAARYHVSRDYIRHRIIDGELPAVRAGRRIIRISSSDLKQLFRPVQALPRDARR
jgi:excisionase family DNA binding protein